MNTDKLSTGGASSAKSKKREGENIVWAIQIGLCYCGVGGKMGCGCAGQEIAQDVSYLDRKVLGFTPSYFRNTLLK